jgi:protein TonB
MRRDLIIGILFSVLLHVGGLLGGEFFNHKEKKPTPKQEPPTVAIEMVKIEDDPEPVDTNEPAPDIATIAPPSLTDVPSAVALDSFVQPVQPPPPPNMGAPTGIVNIPQKSINAGAKRFGEIFDLASLDKVPQAKTPLQVTYPFEMKRMAIEGEVMVEFLVDPTGAVLEPRVVKSTQREFEQEAIRAISKMKFRPGQKSGKAVTTRMQQPISFKITTED